MPLDETDDQDGFNFGVVAVRPRHLKIAMSIRLVAQLGILHTTVVRLRHSPSLYRFGPMLAFFAIVGCSPLPKEKDIYNPPSYFRSNVIESEVYIPTSGGRYWTAVTKNLGKDRSANRAVLLLHELNGQNPSCLILARELSEKGCRVYIPRFYGEFGEKLRYAWLASGTAPFLGGKWRPFCDTTGSIRSDIAEITDYILEENPNMRLTVIGNCMTGAIPLELLAKPRVDTAVVCQPALPVIPCDLERLGLPEESYTRTIRAMTDDPRKRVVSFNYDSDKIACLERQAFLARRLANAGLSDRHLLYVGIGKRPETANSETLAWLRNHPGWHEFPVEATSLHQRHSTVTGAPLPDLLLFREGLYDALGLKKTP